MLSRESAYAKSALNLEYIYANRLVTLGRYFYFKAVCISGIVPDRDLPHQFYPIIMLLIVKGSGVFCVTKFGQSLQTVLHVRALHCNLICEEL